MPRAVGHRLFAELDIACSLWQISVDRGGERLVFQKKPVGEHHIGARNVLERGQRGLVRMRIGAKRNQGSHFRAIPGNVLHQVGNNRRRGRYLHRAGFIWLGRARAPGKHRCAGQQSNENCPAQAGGTAVDVPPYIAVFATKHMPPCDGK